MRKKLIIILTSVIVVIALVVSALFLFGEKPITRDKSNQMVQIMDQTFKSADFVIGEQSGGKEKSAYTNSDTLINTQTFASGESIEQTQASSFGADLSTFSLDSSPTLWHELELITRNFMGLHGGAPLNDSNKKAIKGEAMTLGSPFAGMTRAFIEVYGDKVFNNNYESQGAIFHIEGEGDEYSINAAIKENGKMRSGVKMTFKKHADQTYSYKFVEYSVYYDDTNTHPSSTLTIAMYIEGIGVIRAELEADSSSIFDNYETAYDSFEIKKVTASYFAMENYGSIEYFDSTHEQRKMILDFAKNTLEFNNQTYKDLCAIERTAKIKDQELVELSECAEKFVYFSPYYYETNDSYVRDYYRVPSNVTVIKTGSIPATKTVYIHPQVTLIESRPFLQPQYLERIVFDDPSGGKLTQIGSFDDSIYNPCFILSMTKVKNFSLPSSVKKLELGEYVLNTDVEMLNLSTYNPEWLTDPSKITYNNTNEHTLDNKATAYTTLKIGGVYEFGLKEARYIEKLYMPQFNMSINFNGPNHINVYDQNGEMYSADAHKELNDSLFAYFDLEQGTIEDWVRDLNYTVAHEVIDELYMHKNNNVVPSSYFAGGGSGDDKDKKPKSNQQRKDFDVDLYHYADLYHAESKGGATSRTINTIYLYQKDYFAVYNEELKQYDVEHEFNEFEHVDIVIQGATNLSFSGVSVDSVYMPDGTQKAVTSLQLLEKFHAPYPSGQQSIKTEGQTQTYFVGWSYVENGQVDVYPYQLVQNSYQTLYPVFAPATENVEFIDNGDNTYSVKYIGTQDLDGALVIPSKYNGKEVTAVVENQNKTAISADLIVLGYGIKTYSANAISYRNCSIIFPETIEQITEYNSDYRSEEYYHIYNNAYYYATGSHMFGVLVDVDTSNELANTTCTVHPQTKVISCAAFNGAVFDTVILPEGLLSIGINAFEYSGIKSITIPSTVNNIGYQAFVACDSLETVIISDGVKEISEGMFRGCTALQTVIVPSSITKFGEDPFDDCKPFGNVWTCGRYIGNEDNPYAVLIGINEEYYEDYYEEQPKFTVHEDTVAIALPLSDVNAEILYLSDNIKYIGDGAFTSYCDITTIYYNGSHKDWLLVECGSKNDFSNISVICK